MKVNWATTSGQQAKLDSSSKIILFYFSVNFIWIGLFFQVYTFKKEHYHIFVGDLAPDIDQQQLREAFTSFGEIS